MIRSIRAVVVAVVLLQSYSFTSAEEKIAQELDEAAYTRWAWPIATAHPNRGEMATRLSRLNNILQGKLDTQTDRKNNPGCCLWVEVNQWKPNPGQAGYVIIIQGGGAILIASDYRQVDVAIERIKNALVQKGDDIYLPMGLLTNFPIVAAEEQSR